MKNLLFSDRAERLLFGLSLLFCLAPIWLAGRFFVTGDGPCHVYNARVLLDFWQGRHLDFYDPFYFLNPHFDPNWFGHVVLAGLLLVFSPEVAEKVLLSGYVLGFGWSLRFLLRQINPQSVFLSSVGLIFCWHYLLQSGFYNYAFSVATLLAVGGLWLYWRGDWRRWPLGLALSALWVMLYSQHPIGLAFSFLLVGLAVLADTLAKRSWRVGLAQTAAAAVVALPAGACFVAYLLRKEWPLGANGETVAKVTEDLLRVRMLVTLQSTERDVAIAAGGLVVLSALSAVVFRLRNGWRWQMSDFFLPFWGAVLWAYFRQAGARSLELLMPLRIQIVVWLGLLCWAAVGTFPRAWRTSLALAGCVIVAVLMLKRLPIHQKASLQVEDWVSCTDSIRDRSVVLILNYGWGDLNPPKTYTANKTWLFTHAADYIGAYRTTILSDNYEATRHYFPLIWHWERDMFGQTDFDGINFDHRPPRASILDFKRRTGQQIDYVLLLDQTEADRQHEYSREIAVQLDSAYRQVAVSPQGRAVLYERK